MLKLVAVAVKLMLLTLLPLTVTVWEVGLKLNPVLLGVTVYEPFTKLEKEYAPELLAVVVAEPAPPRVTVAPLPPLVGLIVPEIE